MSRTCVIDCSSGTVTERDMTQEEEARFLGQQADLRDIKRLESARKQRDADLSTIEAGPADPGFALALARLLRTRG